MPITSTPTNSEAGNTLSRARTRVVHGRRSRERENASARVRARAQQRRLIIICRFRVQLRVVRACCIFPSAFALVMIRSEPHRRVIRCFITVVRITIIATIYAETSLAVRVRDAVDDRYSFKGWGRGKIRFPECLVAETFLR